MVDLFILISFLILFSFPFYFLILNLELGVSVMLQICHIITCYTEECKRFQNNNVI